MWGRASLATPAAQSFFFALVGALFFSFLASPSCAWGAVAGVSGGGGGREEGGGARRRAAVGGVARGGWPEGEGEVRCSHKRHKAEALDGVEGGGAGRGRGGDSPQSSC